MNNCVFPPLGGKLFFSINRNSEWVFKKVLFSHNKRIKFPLNKMLYFLPSEAIVFIARIQLLLTDFNLKNLLLIMLSSVILGRHQSEMCLLQKLQRQGIFYSPPTLASSNCIRKVCF